MLEIYIFKEKLVKNCNLSPKNHEIQPKSNDFLLFSHKSSQELSKKLYFSTPSCPAPYIYFVVQGVIHLTMSLLARLVTVMLAMRYGTVQRTLVTWTDRLSVTLLMVLAVTWLEKQLLLWPPAPSGSACRETMTMPTCVFNMPRLCLILLTNTEV